MTEQLEELIRTGLLMYGVGLTVGLVGALILMRKRE